MPQGIIKYYFVIDNEHKNHFLIGTKFQKIYL